MHNIYLKKNHNTEVRNEFFKNFRYGIYFFCLFYFLTTVIGVLSIIFFYDDLIDYYPVLSTLIPFFSSNNLSYFLPLLLPFILLIFTLNFQKKLISPFALFIRRLPRGNFQLTWNKIYIIYKLTTISSITYLLFTNYSNLQNLWFDPYQYRAQFLLNLNSINPYLRIIVFNSLYILIPWISTSLIYKKLKMFKHLGFKKIICNYQIIFIFFSCFFNCILLGQKLHLFLYLLSLSICFLLIPKLKVIDPKIEIKQSHSKKIIYFSLFFLFIAAFYVINSYTYYREITGISNNPLFYLLHPFTRISKSFFGYFPNPPDVSRSFNMGINLFGFKGLFNIDSGAIDDHINLGYSMFGEADEINSIAAAPSFFRAYAMGGWHGYLLALSFIFFVIFCLAAITRLKDESYLYLIPLTIYFSFYSSQAAVHELILSGYGFSIAIFISLFFMPRKKTQT